VHKGLVADDPLAAMSPASGAGGACPSPLTGVVVLFYFILNLALNYYNAYLLGSKSTQLHLPIPVFYTLCHQVAIVTFTSIWCLAVPSVRFPIVETWKSNWNWLIFVSTFYAISIATNNGSFATISLTVNTIFKSAMPFPTMVFSYFIEGKRYSLPIIVIVTVLIAGTLLAVPWQKHSAVPHNTTTAYMLSHRRLSSETSVHDDSNVWIGYVLVTISMVATAMRPVVSSRLMHSAGGAGGRAALTAVSMSFWDALIAIPVLASISLVTEFILADHVIQTFTGVDAMNNVGYVCVGCIMAGVYGPVTFYTIKLTSSLSFIIIGNFKQLALLAGAALFVDKVTEPLLWAGVAVVAAASIAYSIQTNTEKQAAAAVKAAQQKATEATPLKDPLIGGNAGKV